MKNYEIFEKNDSKLVELHIWLFQNLRLVEKIKFFGFLWRHKVKKTIILYIFAKFYRKFDKIFENNDPKLVGIHLWIKFLGFYDCHKVKKRILCIFWPIFIVFEWFFFWNPLFLSHIFYFLWYLFVRKSFYGKFGNRIDAISLFYWRYFKFDTIFEKNDPKLVGLHPWLIQIG